MDITKLKIRYMAVFASTSAAVGGSSGGLTTASFGGRGQDGVSFTHAHVLWRSARRRRRPRKPLFPRLRMRLVRWLYGNSKSGNWFFGALIILTSVLPDMLRHALPHSRRALERDRAAGWRGSAGDGKNKVEFNGKTRSVRVRGQVYTAIDKRTLVLFITDDAAAPNGIRVVQHAVDTSPGAPGLHADPMYRDFISRS